MGESSRGTEDSPDGFWSESRFSTQEENRAPCRIFGRDDSWVTPTGRSALKFLHISPQAMNGMIQTFLRGFKAEEGAVSAWYARRLQIFIRPFSQAYSDHFCFDKTEPPYLFNEFLRSNTRNKDLIPHAPSVPNDPLSRLAVYPEASLTNFSQSMLDLRCLSPGLRSPPSIL
jgi:hypothetical protein